ncbi:hypothetical protein DL93DRAFT_2075296 [Clavulina sp. PMI_390]|nr:hypothetical protein DL93DRAFT_2075296 [Clavulina sp. PMI_390]
MTTYVATLKSSGTELARSDKTESIEGNIYFPGNSVASGFSDSPTPYTCPWKGKSQYHNFGDVNDVAWSYPDPKPAAKNIAGFFAFDKGKVEISSV